MDRKNKGVDERDEYDKSLQAQDMPTDKDVIRSLEKKAELYDKIKSGNTGMLKVASEKYLIDFDREASQRFMNDENYEKDKDNFYKNLHEQA